MEAAEEADVAEEADEAEEADVAESAFSAVEAEEAELSAAAETAGVEGEGDHTGLENSGAAGEPEGKDAGAEDAGVGAAPSEGESADEVAAASALTTPAADRPASPAEDRLHSNETVTTTNSGHTSKPVTSTASNDDASDSAPVTNSQSAGPSEETVWHKVYLHMEKARIKPIALFRSIDADENGTISAQELRAGLKRIVNIDLTDDEFKAVLKFADKDRSNDISYKELSRAIKYGNPERKAKIKAIRKGIPAMEIRRERALHLDLLPLPRRPTCPQRPLSPTSKCLPESRLLIVRVSNKSSLCRRSLCLPVFGASLIEPASRCCAISASHPRNHRPWHPQSSSLGQRYENRTSAGVLRTGTT